MNMLDDDGDNLHTTSESYYCLSDIEWSDVKRLGSTVDEHVVCAIMSALNRYEQHTTVFKFIQHELDESREKITLIYQQGSQPTELLRKQGAQQFELLRQQQAKTAVTGATHERRPKILKIAVSKYSGVEEDFC